MVGRERFGLSTYAVALCRAISVISRTLWSWSSNQAELPAPAIVIEKAAYLKILDKPYWLKLISVALRLCSSLV